MSSATLDRLLALLLTAQLASGVLSLRAGVPGTAPLFWFHGLVGGALLMAVGEKLRRSIGPAVRRRRWGRLALGGLLSLLVAAALAGGFVWAASGRILSVGGWTVMTLHVWAALAVVPVAVAHLLPRRIRLLRPPAGSVRISRRSLLAAGSIAVAGGLVWGAANVLDAIHGGVRRFTGSRWLPAGSIPPPTTFYGEATPTLDVARWRLRVSSRVSAPRELDLEGLAALGTEEREATLDCTSGWALTTRWRGTPLAAVVAATGADPRLARVTVTSVTGWLVRLGPDDVERCLLATHVAGLPLLADNGSPCRLVAPARRGLDWIKWVAAVDVT